MNACLLYPLKVVESLKKVHFTTSLEEQIWFDSTGATAAKYDVVNWQRGVNREVQFKVLGYYDASLPSGKQFVLNVEDIVWAGEKKEVHTLGFIQQSLSNILYKCLCELKLTKNLCMIHKSFVNAELFLHGNHR